MRWLGVAAWLLFGSMPAMAAATSYETRVVAPPILPRQAHDIAADATVLRADTALDSSDTSDLLREVPALRLQRTGGVGAWVTAHLRGSSAQQVSLLWNGVPLHQLALGSFDLTMLPTADDARVEVVRGVTPLAFGSGNIAGGIAIDHPVARQSAASLQLGRGSFGTSTAHGSAAWADAPWSVAATLGGQRTDGDFAFLSDNGTAFRPERGYEARRTNNDLTDRFGQAAVGVRLPQGRRLDAFAWTFEREQGLPGPGSLQRTATRLQSTHHVVSLRYMSHADLPGPSRLRAQVYGARSRQHLRDPLGELWGTPTERTNATQSVGGLVTARWNAAPPLHMEVVAHGSGDQYAAPHAPHVALSNAHRWMGGLGAQGDWAPGKGTLHVIPTLRWDSSHDQSTHGVRRTHVPAARLGLQQQLGDALALRANVARYGRMPTPYELWGDQGRVTPNPALAAETGLNVDIGGVITGQAGAVVLRLESTAFATWAYDLIAFAKTSNGQAQAYNAGQARIVGMDLTVHAKWRPWLESLASVTWLDGRDTSESPQGRRQARLPMRAPWQGFVRPQVCVPLAAHWDMRAHVEVDATGASYSDAVNLAPIPGRVQFNAGLQLSGWQDRLRIALTGRNLGDIRAFDIAGYPLTSRSVFITTRLRTGSAS